MTTKINTVKYSGDPLVKYEKDKSNMVSKGWKVFEENISSKERYLNGMLIETLVSGNIVYEKK